MIWIQAMDNSYWWKHLEFVFVPDVECLREKFIV